MLPDAEGVLQPAQTVDQIVHCVPGIKEMVELDLVQLMNKDSTNMDPGDWTAIAYAISERMSDYQGVLVTHGTDTMVFTAAALSFAFGRSLQIPIVITGSQLLIASFPTDAVFNMQASVATLVEANSRDIAEVMIVFSDMVLRGNRALKRSESQFSAFESPAMGPLGRVTATGVDFTPFAFTRQAVGVPGFNPHFHPNIVTLELTPGSLSSAMMSIIKDGGCRGLVLKSLGAGNVPDSWLSALETVIGKYQIPVLVTTQFVGGRTHLEMYAPGIRALELGVIPTRNMTAPTAAVKLMHLLANGCDTNDKIRKGIDERIVGEVD
jgi:L-asparaginase